METFTLVFWLAGTVPPGICSGMGTGVPVRIQQHSKEHCEDTLKFTLTQHPGSRGMCVPDGTSNAWWINPNPR